MLGKTTNAHGCQANNSIQSAGQSRSVSGCTDSGAVSFLVGAKYLLSKRTGTYVTYNRTNNSGNGCLDYTAASYQSAPGTTAGNCGIAPGTDPRVFAIGMLHNF